MITNKQKVVLCILSLVAIALAVFAILPFNILFDRLGIKVENYQTMELICKLIVFPILVIGVSIYPLCLRKDNYYRQLEVSIGTSKMCYIPSALYLSGLFGWLGGVLYASVSYNNLFYLLLISLLWCGSVVIAFMFGIYTKWLHRLSNKQMLLADILNLIVSILLIVGCFFIYESLETVEPIKENNGFLKMLLYVCLFMVSLMSLWHSLFTDKSALVVLSKDEEFTEEEKEELIVAAIDKKVQSAFEKYYIDNKGTQFDCFKQQDKVEETNAEEK